MKSPSVAQPSSGNPNLLTLSPHLNLDPDTLLSNGNGIFCAGTQGTGKSVILKLLMEQVAEKVSAPIVAFDREEDLKPVVEHLPHGVIGTYRNCPTARDIYADGLQVIYDLSTWPNMDAAGEMIARTIFQLMSEADSLPFNLRVPCLVVADEASYWLPQNRRVSRLDEDVLANLHNAFETLASRGRKRGLVPTLFTQRFSHVAKDVLSPGTYILMRQIVHTEQQRYLDYMLPVGEFYYFTDRQKKQRIADLKPGEAIVKLATGEQVVTQFYKCKSEHAAHTPRSQAARNRYKHMQFERKSYGAYIEDENMDLHATASELPIVQPLSKSARIRQLLEQDSTMKSADIARLVDCDPSMVSRERARLAKEADAMVEGSPQGYVIYALSDPRKDEVKYIGMTGNVTQRYAQHISQTDRSNQVKQSWIDGLKKEGLQPVLTILEDNLERQAAFVRERYWLQVYLERGAKLTNLRDAELMPLELRVDHP